MSKTRLGLLIGVTSQYNGYNETKQSAVLCNVLKETKFRRALTFYHKIMSFNDQEEVEAF